MIGQDYRKVFAEKLNHYMKEKGKSQIDLCNELKYTRSAVSSWCLGTRIPRPEVIDTLADYFRVRRSDLLEYNKEGDENVAIGKEGQKILKAYNNSSKIKVLFDSTYDLSDKESQMLIDIVESMKKSR